MECGIVRCRNRNTTRYILVAHSMVMFSSFPWLLFVCLFSFVDGLEWAVGAKTRSLVNQSMIDKHRYLPFSFF